MGSGCRLLYILPFNQENIPRRNKFCISLKSQNKQMPQVNTKRVFTLEKALTRAFHRSPDVRIALIRSYGVKTAIFKLYEGMCIKTAVAWTVKYKLWTHFYLTFYSLMRFCIECFAKSHKYLLSSTILSTILSTLS